jgi:hypothetical protein
LSTPASLALLYSQFYLDCPRSLLCCPNVNIHRLARELAGNAGYKDESAEEKKDNNIRGYVLFQNQKEIYKQVMYEVTEEIPKVKWYLVDPDTKKEKEPFQVLLFDVLGPLACSHQN